MKSSNPIFDVYYISQNLHLDVRRDLVYSIHGIAICISYSEYCAQPNNGFCSRNVLLIITYR